MSEARTLAGRGRPVLVAACASLLAAATGLPEAGRTADPAHRVVVDPRAGGAYSIRQVNGVCRRQAAEGRARRLIALAESAWVSFGRKEAAHPPPGMEPNPDAGMRTDAAIAGYWATIPADGSTRVRWQRWRRDPAVAREEHWSAAFTSWLMCEAGLDLDQFARSARHIDYVLHAREQSLVAAHRPVNIEYAAPEAGDLLCANTQGAAPRVSELKAPYPLHCFLVIDVSGGEARVIGGNVDGAVAMIRVRLEGSGTNARVVRTPVARWLLLMKLSDPR